MAKPGGTGFVGKLFLTVLAGAVAFAGWRIVSGGVLIDESGLSGTFESALDDSFSSLGLSDSNILKTVRTERRSKFPVPRSWIETEREIVLPPAVSTGAFVHAVEEAAKKLQIVTRVIDGPLLRVECGKGPRVFQKLMIVLPSRAAKRGVQVALVIDDVGGRPSDPKKLEEFFAAGVPITFAVLPMERSTQRSVQALQQKKYQMIVHQPMEPMDMAHNDPGKGALLVGMNAGKIGSTLQSSFKHVPGAVGISNHMGSRFTASAKEMGLLMAAVKKSKEKIFFFDSYTNPKSVGGSAAKKAGVAHLRNDVFLDNADDLAAVAKQLEVLKQTALKKGRASAIGHIQKKATAEAIRKAVPEFRKAGIEFVFLSEFLK